MIGIDLVELEDFNADKFFLLLSKNEQDYVNRSQNPQRRKEVIAGLTAGKEAVFKAMNFQHLGIEVLKSIEIGHNDYGKPFVLINGERQNVEISISHTKTTAVAVAIMLQKN